MIIEKSPFGWVDHNNKACHSCTPADGWDYKYQEIIDGVIVLMSEGERQAVDDVELAEQKEIRITEVDNNTQALILNGFEYPINSGQIFSLSHEAQINITNLPIIKADLSVYPINFNFKDDSGYLTINNALTLMAFYGTAMERKKYLLESGVLLKAQIRASATLEELNGIVDDRV